MGPSMRTDPGPGIGQLPDAPGRHQEGWWSRSDRDPGGCAMTGSVETFQLSVEAAEVYEANFVPALFAEWAPHLVEAAGVAPGQAVLDVACGTGVVARTAADRMGGQGRVVGLDLNQGMLTVAGRLRPDIEWRQGDAASLPFAPGSFDVVLCQSALMFFPDRAGAPAAVATELEATPLARRIDQQTYQRALQAGVEAMAPFVVDGGRVELPIRGHIVTATKVG